MPTHHETWVHQILGLLPPPPPPPRRDILAELRTKLLEYHELLIKASFQKPSHQRLINRQFDTVWKRQWVVPGKVGGVATTAFPDSGSSRDTITTTFVDKHFRKDQVDHEAISSIQLPNGTVVRTLGEIKLPFQFEGETIAHIRSFAILPSCVHDVVLGKTFLRLTQCFTRFKNRIREILVRSVGYPKMHLMGGVDEEVCGQVDGHLASACADTGSDMAISSRFAEKRGYTVDTSHHNTIQVQFADGTYGWTKGKVSDVNWKFGYDSGPDGSFKVDFYVLDNLPCEVILSNEFLFDNNILERYEKHFIRFDDEEDDDELDTFYMIQRVGKSWINTAKKLFKRDPPLVNITPQNLSWQEREEAELYRRADADQMMRSLPLSERPAARAAETELRKRYDSLHPVPPSNASILTSIPPTPALTVASSPDSNALTPVSPTTSKPTFIPNSITHSPSS